MPGEYAVLAAYYETIGMADFANVYTQRLVNFAQANDWLGRQVIDLGCGTGASTRWLATTGYTVAAIDQSSEMLAEARRLSSTNLGIQWLQGDIRALSNAIGTYELAIALDVFNEINSLRDLETVFGAVHRILEPGKLFIFDLHTMQGLAERGEQATEILVENPDLMVILENQYDYDKQTLGQKYTIFHQQGGAWARRMTARTTRGFPVQAVTALLQRANFGIMALLNLNMELVDVTTIRAPRVMFVARKPE